MASRDGPRTLGTDGSDFLHRERVASHYKVSATNKSRLKLVLFMHLSLVLLMVVRLSTFLFVLAGKRPPRFLQRLHFPRAQLWEYVWMASALAAIFGLVSLKKNRSFLLIQSIIGTVLFGLGPVIYASYHMSDDLISYWQTREATLLFLGFPVILLWSMFLVIALQVHGFGLYFSWQLVKAWKSRGVAKKKK